MIPRLRLARAAGAAAPTANPAGATVTPLFEPVPPPVRIVGFRRWSVSPRLLSFILVVLLPVAIAAVYYLGVAADQYVAEFRLSLRTVDAPPVASLTLFGGATPRMAAATESQIVTQFIASRAIVDQLDPQLDLRRLFSPPTADWWSRLGLSAAVEQLVRYWRAQVDPFYDATTGTIVVRVRAFTARDSLRLAQAIVEASEKLINDLSARARSDALNYAEADVARAEARLTRALAALRQFRDRAGTIDPGKTADADAAVAAKLHESLLRANAELVTLKKELRGDGPLLRALEARIRALETEQRTLAQEMTAKAAPKPVAPDASPTPALSQELGAYEALDTERKFAEAAYQHALEALDRARDNANQQHVYIESFVPPSLPETALYPRRWRALGTVVLVAFALWAIGGLAVQSIRDHF